MRCDEIKEGFIDLLYGEIGDSPAGGEAREHLRTCSSCRREFGELKKTSEYLQLWKDESPLKNFSAPERASRRVWRCAAMAAMVLITLLALANTRISINEDGFSFSARLFPERQAEKDYYTKAELRSILKQALDDSEFRTNEANFLMMQKMLDTVERDRWADLRLMRSRLEKNKN